MNSVDIINKIRETLINSNKARDFNHIILSMEHIQNIRKRKEGKKFTFNEHIRALIFAWLSNQKPWEVIELNKDISLRYFIILIKIIFLNKILSILLVK